MCGITGIFNLNNDPFVDRDILARMTGTLEHRGPDDTTLLIEDGIGLGFKRLSIIDLSNGRQPFFSEDHTVSMICNGEIYNYRELRQQLIAKGYRFTTHCDVEVIVHLYKEYGMSLLQHLNGQFAFALFDKKCATLFLARDHFGICPLFYTKSNDTLIFGSEIKAIIKHPAVKREVNLTALDQLFTFPGTLSPTTFFKGVNSLKPGFYATVTRDGTIALQEYWDLDYPLEHCEESIRPESYYTDHLQDLLLKSVKLRLNADVPVGFYLSGGLDSSLIGALMKCANPDKRYKSFSIGFPAAHDSEHDERRYQRLVADRFDFDHQEIPFNWVDIASSLKAAIYHAEGALKESYNTCSLALSSAVKQNGIKVILSGEGADEFFGGYVGYRFDEQRKHTDPGNNLDDLLEAQMCQQLWGDPGFFYEKNKQEIREVKTFIFSDIVNERYPAFDCLKNLAIDKGKLIGRSNFHKRSYLDLKLRLSDHLVSDHADRVNYANSIEGRYPFLDVALLDFVRTIPPQVKLKGLVEKYILKEMAKKHLPAEICHRQKFGFVAPGSPQLIQNNVEWINDMLSFEHIRKQGYFNPHTVERLKKIYAEPGFRVNIPYDDDLLIIVLTFHIFLEVFDMPTLI